MTDILQPKFTAPEEGAADGEPRQQGREPRPDLGREQPAFEKDIEQLSAQVKEYQENALKNKMPHQDLLRSAIGERIQQVAPPAPQKKTDLPVYLENESPEMKTKIQELIDIALMSGVEKSVIEAKKYSPFVLDALHDALTEKIYNELKNRGKLK